MKWQETLGELIEKNGMWPKLQEMAIERNQEKTARNLLARSMPLEDIAQVTELPVEKIRSFAASPSA